MEWNEVHSNILIFEHVVTAQLQKHIVTTHDITHLRKKRYHPFAKISMQSSNKAVLELNFFVQN